MAGMIMRVIMGIELKTDGMYFSPFVPSSLTGPKTLTGLKYRDATLTIQVNGTGNQVKSFTINGKESSDFMLPGRYRRWCRDCDRDGRQHCRETVGKQSATGMDAFDSGNQLERPAG